MFVLEIEMLEDEISVSLLDFHGRKTVFNLNSSVHVNVQYFTRYRLYFYRNEAKNSNSRPIAHEGHSFN